MAGSGREIEVATEKGSGDRVGGSGDREGTVKGWGRARPGQGRTGPLAPPLSQDAGPALGSRVPTQAQFLCRLPLLPSASQLSQQQVHPQLFSASILESPLNLLFYHIQPNSQSCAPRFQHHPEPDSSSTRPPPPSPGPLSPG